MTVTLHPVTVDDREPDAQKVADRIKAIGAPASVSRLSAGDFYWSFERDDSMWAVVVERKTVVDLIASAQDDRVHRFIEGTSGVANMLRFLLIEGDQFSPKNYVHSRWEPEQVDAFLVSVQMSGVVVIHSETAAATPRRLVDLWKWTGKNEHRSLITPTLPRLEQGYIDDVRRDQVRFLMAMGVKIGEKRANAILDQMGLNDAMANMLGGNWQAFAGVKGVGKGLIVGAKQFLEAK